MTRAVCAARTAIAGNPSDGFGGAVLSTVVPSIAATVTVEPFDSFVVRDGTSHLRSLDEIDRHLAQHGYDGATRLVLATLRSIRRHFSAEIDPIQVDVSTTIPRSVGLAGSSAIIIATLRAIAAHHLAHRVEPGDHPDWAGLLLDQPDVLASLALDVERTEMGIVAGLQDRVVQAHGSTMLMEFGDASLRDLPVMGLTAGTYQPVPSLPGGLAVAYRPSAAEDSGVVHARTDRASPTVLAAMSTLAGLARDAATAAQAGDIEEMGRTMNASYDARASCMDLDPRHVEMIALAREHGAWANYTGSGGAIVVLCRTRSETAVVGATLEERLGCTVVELDAGA